MSKTTREIPFTELVERSALISRASDPKDLARTRGAVNDEYCRRIPAFDDWGFLIVGSAIAATAPYNTGTVTATTQSTVITFSTDVTLTADFTGRKFKASENGNVYEITFSNTTGGTINPPLSGDTNITSGAYTIYQPVYALASDFARFPRNGGLQYEQGGRRDIIQEAQSRDDWIKEYTPSPGAKPSRCRLVAYGTAGVPHVEITPPPNKAYVYPYDYVRAVLPLKEVTGGFVDVSAGALTVTGSAGTTFFTEAQTGWFFRIDAFGTGEDSEWYRVIAIGHNSSMTLQAAFGVSGATTARFTLCSAPDMPYQIHPAILYGAAMGVMADQNDPQYALMASQKTAVLLDARRLYTTRITSQELPMITDEYHYRR